MRAVDFTVIDRETNEPREVGLTAQEVVKWHVAQGERSAALALLRYMRPDQEMTLGDVRVIARASS